MQQRQLLNMYQKHPDHILPHALHSQHASRPTMSPFQAPLALPASVSLSSPGASHAEAVSAPANPSSAFPPLAPLHCEALRRRRALKGAAMDRAARSSLLHAPALRLARRRVSLHDGRKHGDVSTQLHGGRLSRQFDVIISHPHARLRRIHMSYTAIPCSFRGGPSVTSRHAPSSRHNAPSRDVTLRTFRVLKFVPHHSSDVGSRRHKHPRQHPLPPCARARKLCGGTFRARGSPHDGAKQSGNVTVATLGNMYGDANEDVSPFT